MLNKVISAIILISCAFLSGLIGHYAFGAPIGTLVFLAGGLTLGLVVLIVIRSLLRADVVGIIGGAAGTLVGALLGWIVLSGLPLLPNNIVALSLGGLIMILFTMMGMQVGASKGTEFERRALRSTDSKQRVIGILDTSVIIDGRIADVCQTGFLDGDLVIPEFILQELQAIADSSDSTKRTRGRRGLDILNKIQKQAYVKIRIDDTDYPAIKEVDQKLIQLAKETGYAILTNDFNLNKVAEVHSIQVLNINRLANSLKPIVLPGETMKVQIIKEGKEPGQGVAYLDDGTMVVVDNGRKFMGKYVEATVTSVLQTTAGRMIFAGLKS